MAHRAVLASLQRVRDRSREVLVSLVAHRTHGIGAIGVRGRQCAYGLRVVTRHARGLVGKRVRRGWHRDGLIVADHAHDVGATGVRDRQRDNPIVAVALAARGVILQRMRDCGYRDIRRLVARESHPVGPLGMVSRQRGNLAVAVTGRAGIFAAAGIVRHRRNGLLRRILGMA